MSKQRPTPQQAWSKGEEAPLVAGLMIVGGLAWLLVTIAGGEPSVWTLFGVAPFAMPCAVIAGGAYSLLRWRAHRGLLAVEAEGLRITEHGRERYFAWHEIGRVRKYLDDETEVVAIERVGELSYVPALGDVRGFPVAADDLVKLVRERSERAHRVEAARAPEGDVDVSGDVAERVRSLRGRPEFDQQHWWLTFCIGGSPGALLAVSHVLAQKGASNVEGADSGFINAKTVVASNPDAVTTAIDEVRAAVAKLGASLLTVDADTDEDVRTSYFAQLWEAPIR